jgi:hypothetical protein
VDGIRRFDQGGAADMTTPDLDVRVAEARDYPSLRDLFVEVYKPGHPLLVERFWDWQFGDVEFGRSCASFDGDRLVGHVGAMFAGGVSWIINVYVNSDYRGHGLLRRMYDLARSFAPLAACNVNRAGLDMYRNMGWIRYADLVRYVAVNPSPPAGALLDAVDGLDGWPAAAGEHYWDQPGIAGVVAPDGSTAVDQLWQGGLRVVDLEDPAGLLEACWSAGVRWVDFVTSWIDPRCRDLDRQGWLPEDDGPLPWRLNPVVEGSRAHLPMLSEEPLPADFIVRRTYSDHGRVGSLTD